MPKFRHKSIARTFEAEQYLHSKPLPKGTYLAKHIDGIEHDDKGHPSVITDEGYVIPLFFGDWVIPGVKGGYDRCSDSIFRLLYELDE